MKIYAPVALQLLLIECGGASAVRAAPQPSPEPEGVVIVTTESRPGASGPFYIEGAVEEVVLLDDGEPVTPKVRDGWEVVDGPSHAFTNLEPSEYTLEAGLRPCGGSCDFLGARTDICSATIPVGNARVYVEVLFRVGEPCVIQVGGA